MGETKKLGEIFTVERDCTPSTGYRWYLTRLDRGLSLVDFGFRCGEEAKPGAGGKAFFTFQAVKEGAAGLQLTKYRTFDLSAADTDEELNYTVSKEAAAVSAEAFNLLGGWTAFAPVDKDSAGVLQEALQGFSGTGYTPLLVAKQLVAGTNYLFVCNARIVYPSAPGYAVVVKVYRPLKGRAEIRGKVQIGHPHIQGGFGAFTLLNPEDELFKDVAQKLLGVGYTPLAAAEQVVAGLNYLFAANAKVVYPGAEPYPVFVRACRPIHGEIEITDIIDAYEYK
jgi:predicted secreted protein